MSAAGGPVGAPGPGAARRRDPRWAWPLYALLALGVLTWAAPRTSLYKRSLLPEMVEGTAWRPYVKRVLTPLELRALSAALPPAAGRALDRL